MIRDLNIRQVKNELRQARQQLACRIGVRDEAHVEQVADAMDQIQAAEAREFALLNLDRYARQLRQVDVSGGNEHAIPSQARTGIWH